MATRNVTNESTLPTIDRLQMSTMAHLITNGEHHCRHWRSTIDAVVAISMATMALFNSDNLLEIAIQTRLRRLNSMSPLLTGVAIGERSIVDNGDPLAIFLISTVDNGEVC